MSVQLCEIKDKHCATVEVMAPDFSADRIWLWSSEDADARIDLSYNQMRQLRDVLNEILGRLP